MTHYLPGRRVRGLVVLLALAALALAAPACSKSQVADTGDPAENAKKHELFEIGLLYESHQNEKGRPPSRLSDLEPYEALYANGFDALRSGRCLAVWGINLKKADAQTVLAYRKEVPTQGGYVLMADQNIKQTTPEEFKRVHKPRS